jgi:hypothetical protein
MPPPKKSSGPVVIRSLKQETAIIRIRSTAPLIVNKGSEKAKEAMLRKRMGERPLAETREAKDPGAIYRQPLPLG